MTQVQKQKSTSSQQTDEVQEMPSKADKGEELKSEMDALLDEIDDVLEVNAEAFVKAYQQVGGQ